MSTRAPMKWMTIIALSIVVASLIALVMFVPQFITMIVAVSSLPPSMTRPIANGAPTPSLARLQARAALASVREEIVPREGTPASYDVTFSNPGYETLVKWNENHKVELRYADAFESLDLLLPCCDWRKPSRDEEKNCACGHHQALEGLSKKLLSDGWDSRAVQREVTQWARFLFPVETLTVEMERRALLDPEMRAALAELRARGEC